MSSDDAPIPGENPMDAVKAAADVVIAELEAARKQIADLQFDLQDMKAGRDSACKLVAEMHEAATGRRGEGPRLGVVEDVAQVKTERDAWHKDATRACAERDGWKEDAERHLRNEFYYTGLLDEIARYFGRESYISDDGSVQQDPLRAKMPDLVAKACLERLKYKSASEQCLKSYDAKVTELVNCEQSRQAVYRERNQLVAALSKLFPASLERHDGADWEDEWRWIVMIDLPAGQASWHIHVTELVWFDHLARNRGRKWDGHSTPEKYVRLGKLEPQHQADAVIRCNWHRESLGLPIPRSCELCAIGPCQCYPGNDK